MIVQTRSNDLSVEESPISQNSALFQSRKKLESIEYLYPYAHKAGIIKTDDEVMGTVLKGLDPDYPAAKFTPNLLEGRFIQFPKKGYSKDILIGLKTAQALDLHLGDTILVFFIQDPPRFRKLVVQGIYQTGMGEFDGRFILGDLRLIQRLNGWTESQVGGFEMFVHNFEQMEEEAIPEVLNIMDPTMGLQTVLSRFMDVFEWLSLLDQNVAIFLVLILVVAGFNMISVFLILIMERVQMIGTLMALGASHGQIQMIFLYRGLQLILWGMVWGNIIGLGFCTVQYYFPFIPLDVENYYMATVPIAWDWGIILGVNFLILVSILLVLLLPSSVISRIRPVKAIRFD